MTARIRKMAALALIAIFTIFGSIAGLSSAAHADEPGPTPGGTTTDYPWDLNDYPWDLADYPWDLNEEPANLHDYPWD